MTTVNKANPAVELKDISKSFGTQPVLRGVCLNLFPGRVHGLIGENGSGKSTLIKILSGYHIPSGGKILLDGELLRFGSPAVSRASGLRFVHQHLGIVPQMNAVENLALGVGFAHPRWVHWTHEVAAARRRLADLHIDMDVEKPLSEARAVERTAVAIARALQQRPGDTIRALVLDEPTAALPPAEVDVLFNVIRQSCRRGIAVLYVSHRLDEVEEITDEVAVLRDGVLVGNRATAEVSRDELIAMMLGGEYAVPASEHPAARSVSASPGDERPILEVKGLRTSTTLSGVDFSVARGEVIGVAGMDGSGREDLARALVGAIGAEGDVTVNGTRLTHLSPAAAVKAGLAFVASVTERGSSIDAFTVKENLTLAALTDMSSWWGLRRNRESATALEWIRRVDIRPADPAKKFALLSGGNKQKVIIAKWLELQQPVYILNEPTAGVDVGTRRRIHEFVLSQAALGFTFIVCSSDLEELEAMCRRVLVLRHGRVRDELRNAEVRQAIMMRKMSDGGAPLRPARNEVPIGWNAL